MSPIRKPVQVNSSTLYPVLLQARVDPHVALNATGAAQPVSRRDDCQNQFIAGPRFRFHVAQEKTPQGLGHTSRDD